MGWAAWVLLALTSAAPPSGAEAQGAPRGASADEEAAALERHVTVVVPGTPELALPRGETHFVEVELPLARVPSGPIAGRVIDFRAPREVQLVPWAEVLAVTPAGQRAAARVRYGVRTSPWAGAGPWRLTGTLELSDADAGPSLALRAVAHTVAVSDATPTAERIDTDRRAYSFHQTAAREAYRLLAPLHDRLRLDRVGPPPPASAVPDDRRLVLESFLHHRLRADIARDRLRAAAQAEGAGEAVGDQALLALGGLFDLRPGPGARSSPSLQGAAAQALSRAEAALDALELEEAEGLVSALRTSGKLDRPALARVLVLAGALELVHGRDADGRRELGRALCIDPALALPFARPALTRFVGRALARERTASCSRPLAVGPLRAERVEGEHGPELRVVAELGPDPRQLAAGGDLELWSGGRASVRAERLSVSRVNGAALEARFRDTGALEDVAGQLFVKVHVTDASGVVVARLGEDAPVPVPLALATEPDELRIPWWVWVVAGGVAVAGGVTVAVVASAHRPLAHGIGPVVVEF